MVYSESSRFLVIGYPVVFSVTEDEYRIKNKIKNIVAYRKLFLLGRCVEVRL